MLDNDVWIKLERWQLSTPAGWPDLKFTGKTSYLTGTVQCQEVAGLMMGGNDSKS